MQNVALADERVPLNTIWSKACSCQEVSPIGLFTSRYGSSETTDGRLARQRHIRRRLGPSDLGDRNDPQGRQRW